MHRSKEVKLGNDPVFAADEYPGLEFVLEHLLAHSEEACVTVGARFHESHVLEQRVQLSTLGASRRIGTTAA
jgi:hypothetical protein